MGIIYIAFVSTKDLQSSAFAVDSSISSSQCNVPVEVEINSLGSSSLCSFFRNSPVVGLYTCVVRGHHRSRLRSIPRFMFKKMQRLYSLALGRDAQR